MWFHKKLRIAILISGRGSNMQAIIRAIQRKEIAGKVVLVLSDREDAAGLDFARKNGIPARYLYPGSFKTKLDGDAELAYIEAIRKSEADLIVLAGFMRVIKPAFLRAFAGKVINIHPSLLPKYRGLHTHRRALESGDSETGCTVHFVNEQVDGGKRIVQARISILPDDTPETLAVRVLKKEHLILPKVVGMIARGEISESDWSDEPLLFEE